MEKEKFLLSKKITLIVLILLSFTYNTTFSQCTNPTPTGDASQVFCKTDNSTIADLIPTGANILWYDAPSGGEFYSDIDFLVDGTTYYADDISGGSCSTSRLAVTVTIYGDFPTNVDVSVGKCAIDNPTIDDLSATGQNLEWYDAQTGGNQLLLSQLIEDGQTYWVQQTENGCTSDRLPTTVQLIDPPTPTTDPIQSFCYPPIAIVGNLKSSGSSVLWYASETSITPLKISTPLIDGEDYWVAEVSFPCVSTGRAQTTVVLDAAPNAGESSEFLECEADLVTTDLFSSLGGTPDTTGIWTGPSVLTGGYLGTFEPGTNIEGTYTYTVSSILGVCPDASANVEVTIIKVPSPTTANAAQVFCEIENATIANLSAVGNNINWYDTENSTTPLNTSDLLLNGEDYWGALPDPTSGCESAVRLVITTTILITPPPTITSVNQSFCEIENATVAELSASGSGILWYDAETSTTPLNTTDILIDGEDYWASQTDPTTGCESAVRLVVNVTVITTPPPTTTSVTQTFCEIENATVANLSVSGSGILWYDTETSTTPLNTTDLLINGEDYWASQTEPASSCEGVSRLVVTATVFSTPPPTTTQINQSFCVKDYLPNSPTIADISASGNGILWYNTETSTTPLNSADLLTDGTPYWATQTDAITGCESASRLVVNVSIINPPTPTTSEVNQVFCVADNPTIANLQVNESSILWFDAETSTTPLNSTDILIDGEDYWASQTEPATGCEGVGRLVVNVTVITTPPPTTTSVTQTFCEIENATIANLSVSGSGILWYDTETSTTPLNTTDLLINGEDYWASQTEPASSCESVSRLVVRATVFSTPPPTTTQINQSFCVKDYFPNSPTVADLSASGNGILWYNTETSTTPLNSTDLLTDSTPYWATQTDAITGCESASRLVVNVSVINPPTPTTSEVNQAFCVADNPTIANLQVNESSILWFDAETSTTPLNTADLLIDGEDYWAANLNVVTGCESIVRIMVAVSITDVPPVSIANVSQTFCASDFPTVENLEASGNNIIWYASETETTPLANTSLLIDGTSYWAVQSNTTTGCESSVRVVVNVNVTAIATPTLISLGNEFCKIDNPTIADLNLNVSSNNGGTISWYDSYPDGNLLNASVALAEGETYYAIETDINGCKSINPLEVTVSLEACDAYDVVIYDGFSPTGNGVNDTFKITNLRELYPNFKVEFFNRWGNLVYTSSAAKSDWNGRLNGDGELSPAGVYYFVIYFNKNDRKPIQRRLYLSR